MYIDFIFIEVARPHIGPSLKRFDRITCFAWYLERRLRSAAVPIPPASDTLQLVIDTVVPPVIGTGQPAADTDRYRWRLLHACRWG